MRNIAEPAHILLPCLSDSNAGSVLANFFIPWVQPVPRVQY